MWRRRKAESRRGALEPRGQGSSEEGDEPRCGRSASKRGTIVDPRSTSPPRLAPGQPLPRRPRDCSLTIWSSSRRQRLPSRGTLRRRDHEVRRELDDVVVEDRVNLELPAERSDVALEGRELDA